MRLNRIAMTGLVAGIMGVVSMPLSAMATTPPSGSWEVGSANSGVCMEASAFKAGSKVVLDNCNGLINQKWYINRAGYDPTGQIAYTLETAKAGAFECLNDINKSTAPGALVNLADCNGINAAERFVIVNGNEFRNIASGECLDSGALGAQLRLNACDMNAVSQMWFQGPNTAKP